MKRFSIVLLVALASAFAGVATPAGATVHHQALIYGDSLAWESMPQTKAQFAVHATWSVAFHPLPTTAPCQWLTWLPADLATYHPTVVVMETAANAWAPDWPCMVDANGAPIVDGTPEFFDRYTADLDTFFATVTATGARLVYMVAPPMLTTVRDADVTRLAQIATTLAGHYHGVSISQRGRVAMSNGGRYTPTKRCMRTETAAMGCDAKHLIAIRTLSGVQAGLHFCPGGLPDAYPWFCATYSSGEYRWARATVSSAVSPPRPVLP